jgi:hypothetical protein
MEPKVNISQAPWQECECGSILFRPVTAAKRLSALLSPDGKEHNIPIELYLCEGCGKIPGFLHKEVPGIPDDLKATPKITS